MSSMKTCPVCGEENPDRARFCMACSSALTDDSLPELRVRKIVTLLFCDITGSTSLGEKLDPESVGRVLAQYYEALKTVVERALARARFRQGNIEEAEQYTGESEHGIPEGTLHFRSRWRAPRALLLAHRGEINEAKRVANEWQRYIDTTDALMHRGDAWMDLAEIFSVEGDLAAARRAAERAVELYTRKIDNCDRERARRFRAELPVT